MKGNNAPVPDERPTKPKRPPKVLPLAFLGSLMLCVGLSVYLFGILVSMVRLALQLGEPWHVFTARVIWYSGLPATLGIMLIGMDFLFLLPNKRRISRNAPLSL